MIALSVRPSSAQAVADDAVVEREQRLGALARQAGAVVVREQHEQRLPHR